MRCAKVAAAVVEMLERRQLLSASPVLLSDSPAPSSAAQSVVPLASQPFVSGSSPANGDTNVNRGAFVRLDVQLVNGAGIDTNTLTLDNVKLDRTSDGQFVNCNLNTDAGGGVIVCTPTALLSANTQYTVKVTTGLKDTAGDAFQAFTMTFTTGTGVPAQDPNIVFTKSNQSNSSGFTYTSVAWGPDNKLYAGTEDGQILRFPVASDGSLGTPQIINTVNTANGGVKQIIIGLEFAPNATAKDPILWVTHSLSTDLNQNNAPDWNGTVSRLWGANLTNYQDYVIHLPRSVRDHMTDQLHFGPDGALYWCQPSMNSMGDVDPEWQRADHPLSGAVLRLDLTKLGNNFPLDAKTTDGGGTYDPNAPNAPLTVYATGIRNGYDFVFDSNGHLYMPANGSAAGGNTPAGPNGNPPAMQDLKETMHDYVFDVKKGGYYGQPNVTRGELILNGGNPTAGVDRNEVSEYPVGTQPDPNYRYDAYDFGENYAPTGVIEYKGNAFGGQLNGKLLVCRYSGGDDVFILTPSHTGNTLSGISGVGMDGLNDPTDIIEDPRTGNLYVCQLGTTNSGLPRNIITLMKPSSPPVLSKLQLINADGGYSLGAFHSKETFNLSDLPTRNLSIKALGNDIAKVSWTIDGSTSTDSSAPFSLKGNNSDGSYVPWTPTTGMHSLTITTFNASGTAGATVDLVFWVIDEKGPIREFVNFQPVDTPYVKGYQHDWGRLYGVRGASSGTFGWNKAAYPFAFDNNNPASPDQRFDTGISPGSRNWQIAVPNGTYSVFLLGGDLDDPVGTYNVAVEGVPALVGSTNAKNPWIGKTVQVNVTDNTLEVRPLAGTKNWKLNFIQIVST